MPILSHLGTLCVSKYSSICAGGAVSVKFVLSMDVFYMCAPNMGVLCFAPEMVGQNFYVSEDVLCLCIEDGVHNVFLCVSMSEMRFTLCACEIG